MSKLGIWGIAITAEIVYDVVLSAHLAVKPEVD